MERKQITIGHLFPDMLSVYGDGGNILTLKNRLLWRDMDVCIKIFNKDDAISFDGIDILYLGGGDHHAQKQVYEKLLPCRDELSAYIEAGGVLLATCGGFEMLGKTFEAEGTTMPGLGILDISVSAGKGRLIGNIVVTSDITGETETFVGFENHPGRMNIGTCAPFGRVITGKGNNGEDGKEGVIYKNVLGTYLHGPLLPKNPRLADEILSRALKQKYQEAVSLAPLCDTFENAAHEYAVNRFSEQ